MAGNGGEGKGKMNGKRANPKHEARNTKQIRNTKSECSKWIPACAGMTVSEIASLRSQ